MRAPDRLPVHGHHYARYHAHRVQGSLSTRITKIICGVVLCLLLAIMTFAFILWLSLRPHRPRVHLHRFSIPGLSEPDNPHININVTVRNPNTNIGIYYGPIDGVVYYKEQRVGSAVLVGYPFYQEPKSTTVVVGQFGGTTLTVTSNRWREFMADREKGVVEFRLEILSTVRFKVASWTFRHHRLHANCVVGVGPDGLILPRYKDERCPVYFT